MPRSTPTFIASEVERNVRPRWDQLLRELWLGNRLVKRFRVPADNQELILSAFEELGWPRHIDDPLPPSAIVDRCERLHAAIKRLNGCQAEPLLKFSGDGRGTGIFWGLINSTQQNGHHVANSSPHGER
jgi:hypothetical protein